eukprot:GILJ01001545.1.p1 GENE.GILJ01001545.1~~GILJ01001545.1.p1  ORF type:complete len:569 (+),score=92.58 GILJ01001545.1:39-1709(+)
MTGVKPVYYEEDDVGKRVKKSKRKYTWKVDLDSTHHTIELYASFLSGKKAVYQDGRPIHESAKIMDQTFQFPFRIRDHLLNIVQHGDTYELRIDNVSFSYLYNQERMKSEFTFDDRDRVREDRRVDRHPQDQDDEYSSNRGRDRQDDRADRYTDRGNTGRTSFSDRPSADSSAPRRPSGGHATGTTAVRSTTTSAPARSGSTVSSAPARSGSTVAPTVRKENPTTFNPRGSAGPKSPAMDLLSDSHAHSAPREMSVVDLFDNSSSLPTYTGVHANTRGDELLTALNGATNLDFSSPVSSNGIHPSNLSSLYEQQNSFVQQQQQEEAQKPAPKLNPNDPWAVADNLLGNLSVAEKKEEKVSTPVVTKSSIPMNLMAKKTSNPSIPSTSGDAFQSGMQSSFPMGGGAAQTGMGFGGQQAAGFGGAPQGYGMAGGMGMGGGMGGGMGMGGYGAAGYPQQTGPNYAALGMGGPQMGGYGGGYGMQQQQGGYGGAGMGMGMGGGMGMGMPMGGGGMGGMGMGGMGGAPQGMTPNPNSSYAQAQSAKSSAALPTSADKFSLF